MTERAGTGKSADAYRTISEVAEELKLPQHVLRFWETRFPQVKPLKRAGGRRFYRPEDVALLQAIKAMLYGQGYTIKGVQRLLQDQGARGVAAALGGAPGGEPEPPRSGRSAEETAARDPDPAVAPPPAARGPAPGVAAVPSAPRSLGSLRRDPVSDADLVARLEVVASDLEDCMRLLAVARTIDDRS